MAIFIVLNCGFTVTMHSLFFNVFGYYTFGDSFLTLFEVLAM